MPRSPPRFCPDCARPLETRPHGGRDRLACPDGACGFVFWDNPFPVVAGLVELDGQVILIQNKGWPESWFGLVTGFLERGETPEAAVLRELKEELSLDGEVVRLIGVYDFEMRNEVIVAYHVRGRGTIALGEELAAFKLVPPEKLRPWPFGTGHAVRDWLASRAAAPGP
jgi:NADH pyrophosphatase NudC (nudix superfamily)